MIAGDSPSNSSAPDAPAPETAADSSPPVQPIPPSADFFVVGIGASAGGLDALSEMLQQLPKETRLALMVVQHMDATHASYLVELLGRVAAMPVEWAKNGQTMESGKVYVAPPKTCVTLKSGVLVLKESPERGGKEIDFFLRSLALDAKERAVGVILSGSNSDGTAGLQAIKRAGGLVFAQDPTTAAFPIMPKSAIDAHCVNRVLAPAAIGRELVKLTQECEDIWRNLAGGAAARRNEPEQLSTLFRLLRTRTGVDFTHYKQTTIKRRLARRMALTRTTDLGEYVTLLQRSRDEVDELYENLLINVTSFFRDPDTFEFLQTEVLPAILQNHQDGSPVRVWVPGCSTGEEAYSIGILIREVMDARGHSVPVQIFATDVSEAAITTARAGRYSAADVSQVSAERLQRFFLRTDHGYMVQKIIRDMCVFARQNVVRDSPFSRLDLISCRNMMIYLSPLLQRKLIPVFHYSLSPTGCLLLGSSESIGAHVDLFRLVDRRFRVYSRKSTNRRASLDFSQDHIGVGLSLNPKPSATVMSDDHQEPSDIIREADRILLTRQGPAGVLVDDDAEILQFRGDVSPYLAPVAGRASLNVLKMVREGLMPELESALREARMLNVRVQRMGIRSSQGETASFVDLDITPIDSGRTKERFFLVLFSPGMPRSKRPDSEAEQSPSTSDSAEQCEQLRRDLLATRSTLQSIIERHEVTNQELRAANEEVQSSNEELQSANEELETAKEELQSTNEEMTTVNEELHSRQLELIQVNNDLQNLINSVHLPIIILGQDLRIRRFTPMAQKVLNVIPSDIGRPFSDINIKLAVPDLPQLISEVVESLTVRELEVQDVQGAWYSMRLRPYKTAESKIDGVVLTLIDIDHIKRSMAELEQARNLAQAVIETTSEPMVVLTADFRVKSANTAFCGLLRLARERAENRPFVDLLNVPAGVVQLHEMLTGILPMSTGTLTVHRIVVDLPGGGLTPLEFGLRQITSAAQAYPLILVSITPRPKESGL